MEKTKLQPTNDLSSLNTSTGDDSNGNWLSLVDYSALSGISISTLRRYIKANKIKYKVEDGRYQIQANGVEKQNELEQKLAFAQEQIDELKMLVAIYEEKLSKLDN
ncbi:MAG: hypothetical protein AB7F43_00205 [Bacteriovoracia bacterium]